MNRGNEDYTGMRKQVHIHRNRIELTELSEEPAIVLKMKQSFISFNNV